jgi:hypothetical protein
MAVQGAAASIGRISHPSLDERSNLGMTARDRVPPFSHAGWSPALDRPGPVRLLSFVAASRPGRLEAAEGV